MLIIKGVQEKTEQEALCRNCGTSYLADHFCYAAKEEDGELRALCQFKIIGQNAVMQGVFLPDGIDDYEAMMLSGRAVLRFLEKCTVQTVRYDDITPSGQKKAVMLGFRKNEAGEFTVDLRVFFAQICNH